MTPYSSTISASVVYKQQNHNVGGYQNVQQQEN
jgi:hypothetical protein